LLILKLAVNGTKKMKLNKSFKFCLLLSLWGSFATGLGWWIFNKWVRVPGGVLGEEHHPLELWFTRFHSALAYLLVLALGYLIAVHIQPGLKGKKKKSSGLTMVAFFFILIASALPILYSPDGNLREGSSFIHTYLGFSIPFLLWVHLNWKKKQRS